GSRTNLECLVEERATLSKCYRTTYGIGTGPKYTPHVSLAYFANKEGGEKASEKIEEWDNALRQCTEDIRIHFDSISVYAFTDMASFFREKRAR
ncbi:MAG: hypothetical protein H7Y17_04020, partial [Chlorobia bacterium]|nr:hypothetical protein [Fimbriimonadaceae bacterium]